MRIVLITALVALPALASAEDLGGDLNPPEMGINRVLQNADRGEVDMMTCASGYFLTKKGDHGKARAVFEACAARGYTEAMTWLSQLHNNGLGGPYDPDAAAAWDQRAAELGDRVGKFNHGINRIRGHGIGKDEALGRQFVDQAASDGLPVAQRLQAAEYDLDEVTPDADNWKSAPLY